MDIIVLLKQVPATESVIRVDADGISIEDDNLKKVVNPYDEFAVEEALRIRDKAKGSVTVVSAGPAKAAEAIRTALAMGADKGILVDDPILKDCDRIAIARILAAAIRKIPFDLIIAGQRAVDDDGFIVGPAVAELLGIPHFSFVTRTEFTEKTMICHQETEEGTITAKADFPLLFTTQRGLNEPRFTSLPGIMKAKKKPIDKMSPADIGLDPADLSKAGTRVEALYPPPQRRQGRIIKGDSPREAAAELVKILKETEKAI